MSLDWLDRNLTTYAYGWRLDRSDGVSLGFTSHDCDICMQGSRYRASPGLVPSSIALTDSLDADSVDIQGVLNAAAISEKDVIEGRWDGAQLHLSLLNWKYPDEEILQLISGEFGQISRSGDAFQVEILGPTTYLDEAVVPTTSPTCRARFGDRQCKLSLHMFQRELSVSSGDGNAMDFSGLAGSAEDYAFGELRWLDGQNSGLSSAILKGQDNSIWLADAPSNPVHAGDRALLTAGCDKNFATCRNRFANSLNFRGEPHLPGNDLLTRYPGA